eukprot:scaffold250_cov110-Isochrysis_galbana.AAC.8
MEASAQASLEARPAPRQPPTPTTAPLCCLLVCLRLDRWAPGALLGLGGAGVGYSRPPPF